TFAIDGVGQAPVSLTNGQAAFSTSTLTAGPHSVVATYNGSAGYAGSASTPLAQGVLNGSATALSSSAAPAVPGRAVTFTAPVRPAPASLSVPPGTVTFVIDGVTQPGAVSLNASRQASITLSNLTVGSHTVRALYSGDANFAAGS